MISIFNTYNESYSITLAFMDLYMSFVLSYFFNLIPYLLIENTDFKNAYGTRNIKYKGFNKDNLNLFLKQVNYTFFFLFLFDIFIQFIEIFSLILIKKIKF